MRAMHQQFTATLEGWPGRTWNCRMSRHRADSEQRTSLQHTDRKSDHCVGRRRRESVWTRVCWGSQVTSQERKTRGETGAQCPRRWCSDTTSAEADVAKATEPTPNATIIDDEDRALSAELYWMMLMICKGAALNIVFLAGDSEGFEAWRQPTEKYEPKMRTQFAGKLMSILSCSLQDDTGSPPGSVRSPRTNVTVARILMMKSRL